MNKKEAAMNNNENNNNKEEVEAKEAVKGLSIDINLIYNDEEVLVPRAVEHDDEQQAKKANHALDTNKIQKPSKANVDYCSSSSSSSSSVTSESGRSSMYPQFTSLSSVTSLPSISMESMNAMNNINKNKIRKNYESDGLSAEEVERVLSELEVRPDSLRDSSTDFRPVFSCIRPIVCHKSNTPFYAQCSTAKLGYCTWCRQQRRGNQRQGSICLNCGERLTAKYHRWYPHLVRLEPLEKTRSKAMYTMYKPVFERFGITWHNEKQFEFVIDHYMLIKIYLSTQNFDVAPLHLERTYMIGVFAGREFNTGALARKLLREGSKLAMFRADFPDYYDFLRDERAAVAEQMNVRFFQGIYKCYFHAHYTNIEGWYDPSTINREHIIETFKALCNAILVKSDSKKKQTPTATPTAKQITFKPPPVQPLNFQTMLNQLQYIPPLLTPTHYNYNQIYNNIQQQKQQQQQTKQPQQNHIISPRYVPSPTANWLPVPPVFNNNHLMVKQQINMSPITMNNIQTPKAQTPLFTPTQSPQFRPFSH